MNLNWDSCDFQGVYNIAAAHIVVVLKKFYLSYLCQYVIDKFTASSSARLVCVRVFSCFPEFCIWFSGLVFLPRKSECYKTHRAEGCSCDCRIIQIYTVIAPVAIYYGLSDSRLELNFAMVLRENTFFTILTHVDTNLIYLCSDTCRTASDSTTTWSLVQWLKCHDTATNVSPELRTS